MLNLFTLLESLKQRPRPLTLREERYLEQLTYEVNHASNYIARWDILKREGLCENNVDKLAAMQHVTLH